MSTPSAYPRIPYGEADFRRIRLNRWLYVDKTRFLRLLEEERYAFLIRPRRFGKSLWVSLLENYYDRFWADDFDATFADTDIGQHPTGEQSRYVTLRFNFSMVNDKLETLEREFETYCLIALRGTLRRHPDLFPEAAVRDILAPPSIATKLSELFWYAGDHDIPLYVLIDEYDNFANTVLAYHGAEAYHSFTHGGGFYRNFFATLKGGADRSGGGLERLFITGVSPVTMDDVTSGFNIGTNISLEPDFNEMVGFTEAEVRRLVETYRELGVFNQDVDTAMGIMGEWYNGYRFAEEAATDLYNTDMVLYYLKHSIPNRRVPTYLIDTNVRIDYGKLRHLLVTSRQLNGNFDLLRDIIGEEQVDTRIQPSFPLERLTDPENFFSLLHYFGLLSIRDVVQRVPRLAIPNQTVKRLMYGYLRDAYRDVGVFSVNLFRVEQLLMAAGVEQGTGRDAASQLTLRTVAFLGSRAGDGALAFGFHFAEFVERPSGDRAAGVHHQVLAADVQALVAAEIHRGVRYVVGMPRAVLRPVLDPPAVQPLHPGAVLLRGLRTGAAPEDRRRDRPRRDAVHAHAVRDQLGGPHLGRLDHPRLAGRVVGR